MVKKFDYDFHIDTWKVAFRATTETKLQILQWKILHNIYPTGIYLNKIGIKDTDICESCNCQDTMEHFFIECIQTQQLWHYVTQIIFKHINKKINLSIIEKLLGMVEHEDLNKNEIDIINKICIITKHSISKFKFNNEYDIISIFKFELKLRKML